LKDSPEYKISVKEKLKAVGEMSFFEVMSLENRNKILSTMKKEMDSFQNPQEKFAYLEKFSMNRENLSYQISRPMEKSHLRVQSEPNTDLYFSMGAFSVRVITVPLVSDISEKGFRVEFMTYISFFDRYNWDSGKTIVILGDFCRKHFSELADDCKNISQVIKTRVSDTSLGRLHKVGIAREYEVTGFSAPKSEQQYVSFDFLKSTNVEEEGLFYGQVMYSLTQRQYLSSETGKVTAEEYLLSVQK
jgi:hypothetical protein